MSWQYDIRAQNNGAVVPSRSSRLAEATGRGWAEELPNWNWRIEWRLPDVRVGGAKNGSPTTGNQVLQQLLLARENPAALSGI